MIISRLEGGLGNQLFQYAAALRLATARNTRLSMILPYNLLNYALGLTAVRLRDYLIGSAIGMVPGIFLFVFFGATATDIAVIMSGELELGNYHWLMVVFGLVAVLVTVMLITRTAQSALKEQLDNPE